MLEILYLIFLAVLWLAVGLAGLVAISAFIQSRQTGAPLLKAARNVIADTWDLWMSR